MDIKKYIASGILELYVLDLLSEKDRQEVGQFLVQYPELQKEVNKIEKALEIYAEGHQLEGSDNLKQKILNRIDKEPQYQTTDKIPERPASRNWLLYLLGLSLLIATIATLWLYSQRQEIQTELASLQAAFQELEEDCKEKDEELIRLTDQLHILLNPEVKKIDLPGTAKAPLAIASVYYNTSTQKTYLNIGSLPVPPTDKQYQLWALVNGQPVDMGFVDVTTSGDTTIVEVPYVENSGAFAVTLEAIDGNPAPNLDEIYLYGENS